MFGLFIALGITLVVLTVVGLAALAVWRRDSMGINLGTFIAAYFYLVSMVSLVAIVSGGAMVTKAIASDWFGRDFSYYDYRSESAPEPFVKDAALTEEQRQQQIEQEKRFREQQEQQLEERYQDDIFNGVSALVVGTIFLAVHIFGWRRMESAKDRQSSLLYKGYVLLQLAMYSLIALVALPLAISGTLRFVMSSTNSNAMPGESFGIALWATPVWLVWVWVTMRVWKKSKA